jgi:hypothetical protein
MYQRKKNYIGFHSSFSLSVSEKIKDKECPVTHCKQCRGLPTAKTCFSYEKLKPKPKTKIGVLICEVLNGFI